MIKRRMIALGMTALCAMLMSTGALAIESSGGGSGMAVGILQAVFGELFGGSGGGPAAHLIKSMNVFALVIAGWLAAYTIYKGVLMTAHDGEMMGKGLHTVWTPIKLTLGLAFVFPWVNGFCIIQHILAWLVLQGFAIADGSWADYTGSMADSYQSQQLNASTLPAPDQEQISQLARSQLSMMTCQESNAVADPDNQFNSVPMTTGDYLTTRRFGVKGVGDATCGSINANGVAGLSVDAVMAIGSMASKIYGYDPAQVSNAFKSAHARASMNMENSLRPLAQSAARGKLTATDTQILENAVKAYIQDIKSMSGSVSSGNPYTEIASAAKNGGWFTAGAVYGKMTAQAAGVAAGAGAAPTASAGDMGAAGLNADAVANGQAAVSGQMANSSGDSSADTGFFASMWAKTKSMVGGAMDKIAGFATSIDPIAAVNNALLKAANGIFGFLTGGGNFFASMHGLGTKMMTAGAGITVAGVVLDSWFHSDALLLISIGVGMISSGAALVMILPLIPFFIYTGAAVGVIASICLSVFAVPLWAMMFTSPNQYEISHHAHGFKKMIAVAVKPAALVFGFIVSCTVFDAVSNYVSSVFFSMAQASASNNGLVMILGVLTLVIAYIALMSKLLVNIFSLGGMFSDQIDSWLDVSTPSVAQSMQGGLAGAAAVAGAASTATTGAMLGGVAKGAAAAKSDATALKNDKASPLGRSGGLNEKVSSGSAGEKTEKNSGQSSGASADSGASPTRSGGSSAQTNSAGNRTAGNKDAPQKPGFGRHASMGAAVAVGNFASQASAAALGGSAPVSGGEATQDRPDPQNMNDPRNPNLRLSEEDGDQAATPANDIPAASNDNMPLASAEDPPAPPSAQNG